MRGETFAYVPGAHPVRDEKNMPVFAEQTIRKKGYSTFQKAGEPLWRKPKPMGHALHFRNAAAKRRAMWNYMVQLQRVGGDPNTFISDRDLILYADEKDVIRVPLYRGFDARFANVMRAAIRKEKRQNFLRQMAQAVAQKVGLAKAASI